MSLYDHLDALLCLEVPFGSHLIVKTRCGLQSRISWEYFSPRIRPLTVAWHSCELTRSFTQQL